MKQIFDLITSETTCRWILIGSGLIMMAVIIAMYIEMKQISHAVHEPIIIIRNDIAPIQGSTNYEEIRAIQTKHQQCLQEAFYFEAGNQEVQGLMAIGQVVRKRVDVKYYANDICDVVHEKKQFSYYWDGKSDTPDLSNPLEEKAWIKAGRVADVYVEGDYPIDPDLIDATMYHAEYVRPDWDWSEVTFIKKVGSHLFYKEKRISKNRKNYYDEQII